MIQKQANCEATIIFNVHAVAMLNVAAHNVEVTKSKQQTTLTTVTSLRFLTLTF